VKLTGVVSDVLRASGRAILTALVAGEADPERLVALTTGRLKAPRATLVDALHGRVTAHHRFLLQLHLTQIDALEAAVRDVEPRVGDALAPFRTAVAHLNHDARHQPHRRPRAPRRDPHRYEPVPDRRPPALLGGIVPPPA